mgnify:CR=1 FL=1
MFFCQTSTVPWRKLVCILLRVFYYNIDVNVRNLSLRTDPTFSCTAGLYVLGMFMIVTSYFFPDDSLTFSPKKGLTNKQLKKLKGSVRPNVRFGSVSSAEPLVRWGSVVRQNQWFGEPNRIPNQKG